MEIDNLRRTYHRKLCEQIIRIRGEKGEKYPNFADGNNKNSRNIAWRIVEKLGYQNEKPLVSGQTAGNLFETLTRDFIQSVFDLLSPLRPGAWIYSTLTKISDFEQYEHLAYVEELIAKDRKLGAALQGGYIIAPDIVVARWAVSDEEINQRDILIAPETKTASLTPLRQANRPAPTKILHASISCKWTIRTDRAQNTRTEALNLIRNRKGQQPHIMAVTAEPTSHRLASLALGTGDLDCVYHFALHELIEAMQELGLEDAYQEIMMMVEGRRLRDISDLPFDLAI